MSNGKQSEYRNNDKHNAHAKWIKVLKEEDKYGNELNESKEEKKTAAQ